MTLGWAVPAGECRYMGFPLWNAQRLHSDVQLRIAVSLSIFRASSDYHIWRQPLAVDLPFLGVSQRAMVICTAPWSLEIATQFWTDPLP